MKILTLVLLSAGLCLAQLKPVAVSPPNTTGMQQLLPSNWVGAGASYNATGSPKVAGWISSAVLVSQSQMLYSYSTYDIIFSAKGVPTSAARTGFATIVRSFGRSWYILGFGTAGVATTAAATTGSFSGGGMLVYRFKKNYTAEAGIRAVTGATTRVIEWGFGYAR